ncbi:hypothetical protein [Nonomuraea sp. 10N515B]|uniref:hypothetical protein n=1 Tax=Nonomuraea sp. 10N515B TaxID=3457422 RepID=UPI003FCCCD0F
MTEDEVARTLREHHPTQPDEDAWEHGADAARNVGEPPMRVQCHVQLLFGDLAEVVTMYHPYDDPLRVPAAALAEQLGVELEALPGCRFTAVIEGDTVRDAELLASDLG